MRSAAHSWYPLGRVLLTAMMWVAAIGISACTVMQALERVPGTDLSGVKVGATREQVEAVLGSARREWVTRAGVRYCLYRYDAGIEPSPAHVTGAVLVEIATLGLSEVIVTTGPESKAFRSRRKFPQIAVSYDSKQIVLGVFDDAGEFAAFPDDGRAPAGVDARPNEGVRSDSRRRAE